MKSRIEVLKEATDKVDIEPKLFLVNDKGDPNRQKRYQASLKGLPTVISADSVEEAKKELFKIAIDLYTWRLKKIEKGEDKKHEDVAYIEISEDGTIKEENF